jgi:DNA (cytosine-5)-methyltransferase 1
VTAGEALGELAFQFDENSKFFSKSMDEYVDRYEKASKCINPRDLYLNKPARTLTCRNLAGATGDMHRVRLKDGRRRRITVREAARLQSFPDWFEFIGTETNQYNQIGNAVAPYFAYHLAANVKDYLSKDDYNNCLTDENNQLELFQDEEVYKS